MKHYAREVQLLVLVMALAFAICWIFKPVMPRSFSDQGIHQSLHKELNLSAEQDKKLAVIEQRFAKRRIQLEAAISEANAELAQALLADKHYSDQVTAAVDKIHHAQVELQKASLEHLFEMQAALTPEQSEKLNRMAADALLRHK